MKDATEQRSIRLWCNKNTSNVDKSSVLACPGLLEIRRFFWSWAMKGSLVLWSESKPIWWSFRLGLLAGWSESVVDVVGNRPSRAVRENENTPEGSFHIAVLCPMIRSKNCDSGAVIWLSMACLSPWNHRSVCSSKYQWTYSEFIIHPHTLDFVLKELCSLYVW